jgi:hypothetical protein
MVASNILLWFTPIYVIGGLLLILLAFSLVARIRGGKYVRPIVNALAKVPLFKRWMQKASRVALEKQNPELASAIAKLERAGVARDPQRAQAALSRLTAGERRAYLEAAGAQGQLPTPSNRQERRRMEKLQKKSQGR